MGEEQPIPTSSVPPRSATSPRRLAFWSVLICTVLAGAVTLSGLVFPQTATVPILVGLAALVVGAFFAPEMPLRRVLRPIYLALAILCGLLAVAFVVMGIIGYQGELRAIAEAKRTGQVACGTGALACLLGIVLIPPPLIVTGGIFLFMYLWLRPKSIPR